MKRTRVVVIGRNCEDDDMTLAITFFWMGSNRPELAKLMKPIEFDHYDMATLPEKGDALDHIGKDVALVIALHLFAIDQLPHPDEQQRQQSLSEACVADGKHPQTCYNRNNSDLIPMCMKLRIPVVVWGDQPWLGVERKTLINENKLWLYEPKEANGKESRKGRAQKTQ